MLWIGERPTKCVGARVGELDEMHLRRAVRGYGSEQAPDILRAPAFWGLSPRCPIKPLVNAENFRTGPVEAA